MNLLALYHVTIHYGGLVQAKTKLHHGEYQVVEI